jgi:uncharacterized membrane protein
MDDDAKKSLGIGLGLSAIGAVAAAAAISGTVAVRKARRSRPHDDAPGSATHSSKFGAYDVASRAVTIDRPRHELYAFWRDFQNLPRVMDNVEAIRPTGGDGRAVWTIRAPGGRTVDIETEIARDEADKLIAWRSVPGSDIDTEGRVEFDDTVGERGTKVRLIIAYRPPGGDLGRLAAKAFGREPAVQARRDLKRFKMLMETGEIATSQMRKAG